MYLLFVWVHGVGTWFKCGVWQVSRAGKRALLAVARLPQRGSHSLRAFGTPIAGHCPIRPPTCPVHCCAMAWGPRQGRRLRLVSGSAPLSPFGGAGLRPHQSGRPRRAPLARRARTGGPPADASAWPQHCPLDACSPRSGVTAASRAAGMAVVQWKKLWSAACGS